RLLSALTRYVPSPDKHAIGATQNGKETELSGQPNGALALAVFKTIVDRYVGRMSYVRNFSGTLRKDDRLAPTRTGHEDRIANLFQVRGKELTPVDELAAGDIGVITKLENVLTGDTLGHLADHIVVPPPVFAQPLYSVAVTPATKADSAKMGQALA